MTLSVGDQYSVQVRFDQRDVIAFADVTGDRNPLHLDPEYASSTVFGRPILHGFLAGSVFSRIFGTEFPGEGTVYLNQEMSFRKPMYAGFEYVAHFEVQDIDVVKHRGQIRCRVLDDEGRECIVGSAVLLNPTRF